MTFGGQTVTFVAVTTTGQPGYLGIKAQTRSEIAVPGCHFRPAGVSEANTGATDVAAGLWKCTAPPVAAVLSAKPDGELQHAGITYLIDGPPQPKYDLDGAVHHVTVLCRRQVS